MDDVATRVEGAFERHFRRTPEEPDGFEWALTKDADFSYIWERHGESVVDAIGMAASVSEEVATDLQAILAERHYDRHSAMAGEETEFADESHYEEVDANDVEWQTEWRWFEHSLKTEARFFSRAAMDLLDAVFGGIENMSTEFGAPLVIDAGPKSPLEEVWRARAFQSKTELKAALAEPDRKLGAPPGRIARAGRMNAVGISVFNGARTPYVALAEVRPPVGSHVAVARFKIIRKLRILDLTALGEMSEKGSVFDETLAPRMERASFLRSLSRRITRPVMPDDSTFDYLPTQAIADYLANVRDPRLDGVAFPSSQTSKDAVTVVLFHRASRVERRVAADRLKVEVSEDTDAEARPGFSVIEIESEPWMLRPMDSWQAVQEWYCSGRPTYPKSPILR